jgi:hypothetical protein
MVALFVLLCAVAAIATDGATECRLSELTGHLLEDAEGRRHLACSLAEGPVPLVGLLVASGVCEACLALRSQLLPLAPDAVRLVLVSRDPNEARYRRHLRALGPAALAVPYEDESVNDRLGRPSLPTVSLFVYCQSLPHSASWWSSKHLPGACWTAAAITRCCIWDRPNASHIGNAVESRRPTSQKRTTRPCTAPPTPPRPRSSPASSPPPRMTQPNEL